VKKYPSAFGDDRAYVEVHAPRSKEAFLPEVIRPFNARMSGGVKPTVPNIYAEGETAIVFFDASGTARDGKPYANTYAWFLSLESSR
jgi:uncharacterized protein